MFSFSAPSFSWIPFLGESLPKSDPSFRESPELALVSMLTQDKPLHLLGQILNTLRAYILGTQGPVEAQPEYHESIDILRQVQVIRIISKKLYSKNHSRIPNHQILHMKFSPQLITNNYLKNSFTAPLHLYYIAP